MAVQRNKFSEVRAGLAEEKNGKEELLQELERYKQYLGEAEGLLKEVNERHKGACEEIMILQNEKDAYSTVNQ